MEALIAAGLAAMNLTPSIPAESAQQLAKYGRLMLEKNQVINLTAIREETGVAQLHMLDSAALLPCTQLAGKTLIDVGTGAGLPGLALKILVPSLQVTLLDSLNKRLEWLDKVAAQLELTNVTTLHARAEEQCHLPTYREQFDVATARAVADLRILCELCLPYLKVGGVFLAMKTVDCDAEVAQAAHAIHTLGGKFQRQVDYTIPNTQVSHRVVVIEKVAPTPPAYPRRWAKMQKDPLSM